MKFIQGKSRTQTTLFPISLEASIDDDNEVRIIDLFVDSLKIEEYGFKVDFVENGRPGYRPAKSLSQIRFLESIFYLPVNRLYLIRNLNGNGGF